MMMTGRMMSATEMGKYGLVNSVVPQAQLDAEVDSWVADILSAAPLSLRAIKAVVRETPDMSTHDAFTRQTPELISALNSEDADEGVAQKFPRAASFKINLSSVRSDTARLKRSFSFCKRFSSFN